MGPKLYRIIALSVVLVLLVVAAVWAIRAKLPRFIMMSDRTTRTAGTPTISHAIVTSQPSITVATIVPVTPIATSTPDSQKLSTGIPCFTFEQLPAFAFTPNSSGLMVRVNSGVQVFNLDSGALEETIMSSQPLTAVALSPDSETLAWALQDNTIQLVQVPDQVVLRTMSGHTDTVTKLGFTPGGDMLVSASHDHSVKVWSLSGEQLRSIQTDALGMGISHDGSMLATIPFDGPVALWDLATGQKIKDLGGYGGYDTSDAVFSQDGQYLAADLAAGLSLWRIADASVIWDGINSMAVAFSPDGQYLAFSNIDNGNDVILASADGRYLRSIDAMQSPVWELTFSPDASLLSINDGTEIHVRTVNDGAMAAIGKSACP